MTTMVCGAGACGAVAYGAGMADPTMLPAAAGATAPLALAAALCFPLTLALQKVIPGT